MRPPHPQLRAWAQCDRAVWLWAVAVGRSTPPPFRLPTLLPREVTIENQWWSSGQLSRPDGRLSFSNRHLARLCRKFPRHFRGLGSDTPPPVRIPPGPPLIPLYYLVICSPKGASAKPRKGRAYSAWQRREANWRRRTRSPNSRCSRAILQRAISHLALARFIPPPVRGWTSWRPVGHWRAPHPYRG